MRQCNLLTWKVCPCEKPHPEKETSSKLNSTKGRLVSDNSRRGQTKSGSLASSFQKTRPGLLSSCSLVVNIECIPFTLVASGTNSNWIPNTVDYKHPRYPVSHPRSAFYQKTLIYIPTVITNSIFFSTCHRITAKDRFFLLRPTSQVCSLFLVAFVKDISADLKQGLDGYL